MEQKSIYASQNASKVNEALKALPVAKLHELKAVMGNKQKMQDITDKGVFCMGKHVATVGKDYKLVQHEAAFRPIVEGLTVSGVSDFKFSTWHNAKRASFAVTVGSEVEDGVRVGFTASNGHTGIQAIDFGFRVSKVETETHIVTKTHVTVWGVRQVCSNGMKIRVPIESVKYLDAVQREKLTTLVQMFKKIRHKGDVVLKLEQVQYIVEAYALLRKPVGAMIRDAKLIHLPRRDAEALVEAYVGKRLKDRVLDLYGGEGQTLWGLYNAMTYLASHDENLKDRSRNRLLDQSAEMLQVQLKA